MLLLGELTKTFCGVSYRHRPQTQSLLNRLGERPIEAMLLLGAAGRSEPFPQRVRTLWPHL